MLSVTSSKPCFLNFSNQSSWTLELNVMCKPRFLFREFVCKSCIYFVELSKDRVKDGPSSGLLAIPEPVSTVTLTYSLE